MMGALPYLIFPACALLAVLVIGLLQRGKPLDDRGLLLAFIGLFTVSFLIAMSVVRSQWMAVKLDPQVQVATDLQSHPVFVALENYNLDEDRAWRNALQQEVAKGASIAEVLEKARPALALMGRERLGFADEQAHLAWARAELTALKELRALDAGLCAKLAASQGDKAGYLTLGPGMSAEYATQFEQAWLAVLSTADAGMRREGKPPSAKVELDQMQRRYSELRETLVQRHGEAVVDFTERGRYGTAEPYNDPRALCEFRISQLDSMLREPPAMAARLLDAAMR